MGVGEYLLSKIGYPQENKVLAELAVSKSGSSSGKRIIIDGEKPVGVKTTPEIVRVKKEDLEVAYISDPTMFNIINKSSQVIMKAGYRFIGDDESVSFFEEFFDGIGSRGGETEWKFLLSSIFRHQMVYGNGWIEKIPSKRNKNLTVDLDLLDGKKMGYALNSNEKIVLDDFMNPVGYIQTLPTDYSFEERHKPPEEVVVMTNQRFFNPEQVVHFKLYTIGDGFDGLGLIEPVYTEIRRKQAMEEAHANAIKKVGFPTREVIIGDLTHEPTTDIVQKAMEEITNMDYKSVLAHPYWIKYGIVEAKRPEKLKEFLEYYTNEIVAGGGLPKAHATGGGESTNRATLNRQEYLTKIALKDIAETTAHLICKQIIKPIAAVRGIKPVSIEWGDISIEDIDSKANRIAIYAKAKLLTPGPKLEKYIRNLEGLPGS